MTEPSIVLSPDMQALLSSRIDQLSREEFIRRTDEGPHLAVVWVPSFAAGAPDNKMRPRYLLGVMDLPAMKKFGRAQLLKIESGDMVIFSPPANMHRGQVLRLDVDSNGDVIEV